MHRHMPRIAPSSLRSFAAHLCSLRLAARRFLRWGGGLWDVWRQLWTAPILHPSESGMHAASISAEPSGDRAVGDYSTICCRGILPGRALFTDLQTQIDLMYTDFAAGCAVLSGSAVEWGRVTAVSEVSGWRRQCYAWAELYGRHRAERYVGTEWSSM